MQLEAQRDLGYLIGSILIKLIGLYLMKLAATWSGELYLLFEFINPFYLLSLVAFAVQAVLWTRALRAFPLGIAYASSTLYYPGVLMLAYWVFNEPVKMSQLLGVALMMAGIILVFSKFLNRIQMQNCD